MYIIKPIYLNVVIADDKPLTKHFVIFSEHRSR